MKKRPSDSAYLVLGLRIVSDFGATIAVPVVLFAWIGKTLDARWNTDPFMLLTGFALAATVSTLSIRKKAKVYGKRYQDLIEAEKKTEPSTNEEETPHH